MDTPRPYADDLARVPQGSVLLRRIAPRFYVFPVDGDPDPGRVSSGAFQEQRAEHALALGCPGPGVSFSLDVDPGRLVVLQAQFDGDGWARVEADFIRTLQSNDLGLDHRPTDLDPNHVVLFVKSGGKLKDPTRRKLAKHATERLVVPPRPV